VFSPEDFRCVGYTIRQPMRKPGRKDEKQKAKKPKNRKAKKSKAEKPHPVEAG